MSNTCMVGFDGKVYYNDKADTTSAGAGTYEVPVWVEIPMVKDVTVSSSADKIDDTDRGSTFKKYCAGQFDLDAVMNLSYRNGNAILEVIRDAWLARTTLDVMILDGDEATTGTEGFRIQTKCFTHDWEQTMSDVMMVDINLAPTYFENAAGNEVEPEWVTMA